MKTMLKIFAATLLFAHSGIGSARTKTKAKLIASNKKARAVVVVPQQESKPTVGINDATFYVGTYQFKGMEAGISTAVRLYQYNGGSQFMPIRILSEFGMQRGRWNYHEVEYNRFSINLDARADLLVSDMLTPYATFGAVAQREWFRGSEEALDSTAPNINCGIFINISESFATRLEYAPLRGSIRIGGTVKL